MNQSRQITEALGGNALPPEPVIIRRWKDDGSLIAIFPEWEAAPGGKVQMWGDDGGGSGDMKGVMRQTNPVTDYNADDVKMFLTNLKRSALPDGAKDYKLVKK